MNACSRFALTAVFLAVCSMLLSGCLFAHMHRRHMRVRHHVIHNMPKVHVHGPRCGHVFMKGKWIHKGKRHHRTHCD